MSGGSYAKYVDIAVEKSIVSLTMLDVERINESAVPR